LVDITVKASGGTDTNPGVDCEELTGEIIIKEYVNTEAINFERIKKAGGNADGGITKVTIINCPKLKTIDLDQNKITDIVLEGNFDQV